MIFFKLIIFRYLYFIQFGRALNYSNLLDQVHSHLVQLRSYAKDMTITICDNKRTDSRLGWSVDDVMARKDGPENLRILKRYQLDFYHWR